MRRLLRGLSFLAATAVAPLAHADVPPSKPDCKCSASPEGQKPPSASSAGLAGALAAALVLLRRR